MNIQSTQIGGKGTMRRKKKRTGHNFQERITKEDIDYKNKIIRINNHIEQITDNHDYDKFKLFLDSELEDIGCSIDKIDLKKLHKSDYELIKDDELVYVYNLLISDVDRPIKFNETAFKTIKKKYEEDCIEMIMDFIRDIESVLEKKTYLESI